jgi:hypothetical protein
MFDPAASPSQEGQQMLDPSWSAPQNVSSSSGRAVNPEVIAGANSVVHLVWEDNDRIYHAVRRAGSWMQPQSIATGQRPAAGLTANGALHVVFSNEFSGRYNVFHAVWDNDVWSLPRLVSKTPGMSTFPSLAVDRAGVVHAVWADTSPGYSVIYHGWLTSTWLNEPLGNARGTAPVLALDGAVDELHLAYQASGINNGPREIYHLQGQTYIWTLPENISLSPDQESLSVAMVCAPNGSTHFAWQEHVGNTAHIRYVSGQRASWSAPQQVSAAGVDAREPALLVTQHSQLSLIWREQDVIAYCKRELNSGPWTQVQPLVSNPAGLGGVTMAGSPAGDLHLVWSAAASSNVRDIFHSQHAPLLEPKVYFPTVVIGRL